MRRRRRSWGGQGLQEGGAGEDVDLKEEEPGRTSTSRRSNWGEQGLGGGGAGEDVDFEGEDEDFEGEEPGRTRTSRASGETPQSPFQAHLLRGYSADSSWECCVMHKTNA